MPRIDDIFCANPRCVLHVTHEDPNVIGQGDWATLPNGLTFARVRVGEVFYCHACAENPDNPPEFDRFGE
jgi:hypothetical protein